MTGRRTYCGTWIRIHGPRFESRNKLALPTVTAQWRPDDTDRDRTRIHGSHQPARSRQLSELMTEEHVLVDSLGRGMQGRATMRNNWGAYYAFCRDFTGVARRHFCGRKHRCCVWCGGRHHWREREAAGCQQMADTCRVARCGGKRLGQRVACLCG